MPARRLVVVAAVAAGVVLGGACGDRTDTSGRRTKVVASFYPMAEIASRVGDDRVDVANLTPIGTEPHDIELTSRQVDELQDADLVVYVGKGFQPAVAEIASRRSRGTLDVLDGGLGPHFWLDPTFMAQAVDDVTRALTAIAPADRDAFDSNARRFKDELNVLDSDFRQGLAACDRKEIVTSHAAFSYLARRYGLTEMPIAGLSPEAEPDAARIATLTNEIRSKGVTTVFYEELVSPEVAETLAREAGVRTDVLSPIEGLTEDQIAAGKDYLKVMRDNLAALRVALGCR